MLNHDHPLRYALVNELHARPFPVLATPCTAVFIAIKEPAGPLGAALYRLDPRLSVVGLI